MAEVTTPLMTRYEMGRLAEFKAQGVPHEEAKARVYTERGASGEPRTGPAGPASAPGQLAKPVSPSPVPVVVVASSGPSPWWGILAILAVVIYFGSRKQEAPVIVMESSDEIGDMPTGMMAKPKRKR
jgi:hypothetical protein